ncbi:MAG: hypothetical protein JWO59_1997 [Chloroflexi bacterium]|nr:hypothetical protein [Chloroflexota bacterium]
MRTSRHAAAFTAAIALVATQLSAHPVAAGNPAHAATAAPLTWKQLQNTTYPAFMSPSHKVTLHNGTFKHEAGMDKYYAGLDKHYAIGDLNGDGVPDAAVALWQSGGGSGVFFSLVAMLDKGGKPVPAGSVELGDRPYIKSIAITGGKIVLKMNYASAKAPACCPDTATAMTFALSHGKLKLLKQVDKRLK